MFKKYLRLAAVVGVAALPAFAQDAQQDAAAQITGHFGQESTTNGVRHDSSDSAGFLGTYRYFFHRNHGVEGNYGYTRNTQRFGLGGVNAGIRTNTHEVSGAYVWRLPKARVTPFALAGVGALLFDGANRSADLVTRPSFNYGGGADIRITDRLFVRAQYRGQVYETPRFGGIAIVPFTERFTHQVQPSVGFGWRF
jgi:opacity protein-like surface antigen